MNGFRVIAHDRRSHGRSDQTWTGNDMDTYADDLAALLDALEIKDAMLVGHSTGGGEVAHYIGRHGTSRVAKAVLIGAVPPIMRADSIVQERFRAIAGIEKANLSRRHCPRGATRWHQLPAKRPNQSLG